MSEREFSIPKMYNLEEDATDYSARIIAEPFERGYGTTVGNALRRVLLSALEGSAITAIRFENIPHEFSAIPGVYEDTTDVVLNLKRCRIRLNEGENRIFTFSHTGEGEVTAADLFEGQPIEVFNPDLVVFTATQSDTVVEMEIKVAKGRGYVTADQFEFEHAPLGTIYLDANFSPIVKVNFQIEDARVGQVTDFDRLVLDVLTDGSISPADAVRSAAALLIRHLDIFTLNPSEKHPDADQELQEQMEMMRLFARPVEQLELNVRSSNCLKAAKIATVGALVSLTEAQLMELPNFGKKSLEEIYSVLEAHKLSLGMNVRMPENMSEDLLAADEAPKDPDEEELLNEDDDGDFADDMDEDE